MALTKDDAVRNERLKLLAEAFSNLGVAALGVGVLTKLFNAMVAATAPGGPLDRIGMDLLVWAALGLDLHGLGQWTLRGLRA